MGEALLVIGEADPSHEPHISPYEGAADLNAPAALQLDGVLSIEGNELSGELWVSPTGSSLTAGRRR